MGALRLQRHLASLASSRLLLVLALLVAIYAAIDIVEVESMTAGGMLAFYPLRLPAVVSHVLPLAATLGALLALGSLRRHGEWDALLAAGIGPGRLIPGLAAGSLLATVAMVPLALELAPRAGAAWAAEASSSSREAATPAGRWIAVDRDLLVRVHLDKSEWRPAELVELPGADHQGLRLADHPSSGNGAAAGGAMERAQAMASLLGAHDEPAPLSWSGLAGQTLARARLDAAIEVRRRAGIETADLEAERALRRGLIAACALLPLAGLLLAGRAGLKRAGALAGLGLGLGLGYWLLTAVAWNGAAAGAWSAAWICPGVPAGFASLALLAFCSAPRGS